VNERIFISNTVFEVEFISSAFKHGQNKEDILYALENSIYDEILESGPNKVLSIGFSRSAKLIEVIFHVLSDEHIVVFHAMPCRKHYTKRMVI